MEYPFKINTIKHTWTHIKNKKIGNDQNLLIDEFKKRLHLNKTEDLSILGCDIYQYSQYDEYTQPLLPIAFKKILEKTFRDCKYHERFLFQKYIENDINIQDCMIDTGDGGFLVFETPLQSLVFALNLSCSFHEFNSGRFYKSLGQVIGPISMRYAITYDKTYKIEKNFYGRSIINNARIMAKDRLDRCLIDENTYNWFLKNTNGIQSLRILPIESIFNLPVFSDYNKSITDNPSLFFVKNGALSYIGLDVLDACKIGEITSKSDIISIYNIHLQYKYKYKYKYSDDGVDTNEVERPIVEYFTVALGNLNSTGIN